MASIPVFMLLISLAVLNGGAGIAGVPVPSPLTWECKQWQYRASPFRSVFTESEAKCRAECNKPSYRARCKALVYEPGQGSRSCRLYGASSRTAPEVSFAAGGTICSESIKHTPPVVSGEGCEQKAGVKGTRTNKPVKVQSFDECKSKCTLPDCKQFLYRYSPANNAFYCDFLKEGGTNDLRYFAGEKLCSNEKPKIVPSAELKCGKWEIYADKVDNIFLSTSSLTTSYDLNVYKKVCRRLCEERGDYCDLFKIEGYYCAIYKVVGDRVKGKQVMYRPGEEACSFKLEGPTPPFPENGCDPDAFNFVAGERFSTQKVSTVEECTTLCDGHPDCYFALTRYENGLNSPLICDLAVEVDFQSLYLYPKESVCKRRTPLPQPPCGSWVVFGRAENPYNPERYRMSSEKKCLWHCNKKGFDISSYEPTMKDSECGCWSSKGGPQQVLLREGGKFCSHTFSTRVPVREPATGCDQIKVGGIRNRDKIVSSAAECMQHCVETTEIKCDYALTREDHTTGKFVCNAFGYRVETRYGVAIEVFYLKYYPNETACPKPKPAITMQ